MQRNGVTHFLRGQLRLRLILVKSGIQLLTLLLHLNFKQQADPPRQGLRSADEQSFTEGPDAAFEPTLRFFRMSGTR